MCCATYIWFDVCVCFSTHHLLRLITTSDHWSYVTAYAWTHGTLRTSRFYSPAQVCDRHMNTQVISAAVSNSTKTNCGIGRTLSSPLNTVWLCCSLSMILLKYIHFLILDNQLYLFSQVVSSFLSVLSAQNCIFSMVILHLNFTRKPVFWASDRGLVTNSFL